MTGIQLPLKTIMPVLSTFFTVMYLLFVREPENPGHLLVTYKIPLLALFLVAAILIYLLVCNPAKSPVFNTAVSMVLGVPAAACSAFLILLVNAYLGPDTVHEFNGKIINRIDYGEHCGLVIESPDLHATVTRKLPSPECRAVSPGSMYTFRSHRGLLGFFYKQNPYLGIYVIYLLMGMMCGALYLYERL